MSYMEYLHTNSKYANDNINSTNLVNTNIDPIAKYKGNIARLEEIEKSFYSNIEIEGVKYTDFLSFMQALRKLL